MEQKINGKTYKFFYNGIFSNWYMVKFTVNGITFNCGEQYMMYSKAMFFGDNQTAEKILKAETPKIQKRLGREVKNFNSNTWDKYKFEIVKKGLFEKFIQNEYFKNELLKYVDYIFVEASPVDRIWGIGYDVNSAKNNYYDWGENLLGKALTEIAQELKKESIRSKIWCNDTKPTKSDWFLVKIDGKRGILYWNSRNEFFSDFAGKTYEFNKIDCWLNDEILN